MLLDHAELPCACTHIIHAWFTLVLLVSFCLWICASHSFVLFFPRVLALPAGGGGVGGGGARQQVVLADASNFSGQRIVSRIYSTQDTVTMKMQGNTICVRKKSHVKVSRTNAAAVLLYRRKVDCRWLYRPLGLTRSDAKAFGADAGLKESSALFQCARLILAWSAGSFVVQATLSHVVKKLQASRVRHPPAPLNAWLRLLALSSSFPTPSPFVCLRVDNHHPLAPLAIQRRLFTLYLFLSSLFPCSPSFPLNLSRSSHPPGRSFLLFGCFPILHPGPDGVQRCPARRRRVHLHGPLKLHRYLLKGPLEQHGEPVAI